MLKSKIRDKKYAFYRSSAELDLITKIHQLNNRIKI
jgi:hypothetical protein